jgi:hypothetical protein
MSFDFAQDEGNFFKHRYHWNAPLILSKDMGTRNRRRYLTVP